eukprot:1179465-Prorocentrum_minimum.AAC.12
MQAAHHSEGGQPADPDRVRGAEPSAGTEGVRLAQPARRHAGHVPERRLTPHRGRRPEAEEHKKGVSAAFHLIKEGDYLAARRVVVCVVGARVCVRVANRRRRCSLKESEGVVPAYTTGP